MKRWGKIGIILMAAVLALSFILPVYASSIDDARGQKDEIDNEISQREAEIEDLKSEMEIIIDRLDSLQADLTAARRKLSDLNNQVTNLEREIEEQEKLIEEKIQEIAETEEYLELQIEYLERRLRAMYRNGAVTYLEVLFSATSFSDFISRFNFVRSLIESDAALVNEIQEVRDQLELDKQFLDEELERQVQRKVELEDTLNEAKRETARVENLVVENQQLEAEAIRQLDSLESSIKELQADRNEIDELIKRLEEEERQKNNPQQPPSAMTWPIILRDSGARITSIPRLGRFADVRSFGIHGGIDFSPPHLHSIGHRNYGGSNPAIAVAAASGTVVFSGWGNSYGWYLIINHGGGYQTLYAHMHWRSELSPGDTVSAGQKVGYIGTTGHSTGPHLHFEVIKNGVRVDPLPYIQ